MATQMIALNDERACLRKKMTKARYVKNQTEHYSKYFKMQFIFHIATLVLLEIIRIQCLSQSGRAVRAAAYPPLPPIMSRKLLPPGNVVDSRSCDISQRKVRQIYFSYSGELKNFKRSGEFMNDPRESSLPSESSRMSVGTPTRRYFRASSLLLSSSTSAITGMLSLVRTD